MERPGLAAWRRRNELRQGSRSRPIVRKDRRKPKYKKVNDDDHS